MKSATLHIDLDSIIYNYRHLKCYYKKNVIAVLKDDAYGVGLIEIYKALQYEEGLIIAVSDLLETKQLRDNNYKGDILYLPKTLESSQETNGESIIAIHFINYSFKKDNNAELITLNNSEYAEGIVRKMYDIWKEKKQGHK